MATLPAVAAPASTRWHVSAAADAVFYHWSWAAFFVPLVLAGDKHWSDYVAVWVIGNTISFVHRHFTMPYVYLDRQVFEQHRARFVVAPIGLCVGFMLTPGIHRITLQPGTLFPAEIAAMLAAVAVGVYAFLADRRGHKFSDRAIGLMSAALCALGLVVWSGAWYEARIATVSLIAAIVGAVGAAVAFEVEPTATRRWGVSAALVGLGALAAALGPLELAVAPAEPFALKAAFAILAAFTAAWNIWHVYMQKYGIMRMYSAKAGGVGGAPALDRWLVFAWIPVYLIWFGATARPLVEKHAKVILSVVDPIMTFSEAVFPWAFPLTVGFLVASICAWIYTEWTTNRFDNTPRLSMALGTTALGAAVLWSPLKGYMAYGFAHAVEYIVFVWAFQNRRYEKPLEHDPWLGRLLRHPWAAYAAFFGFVGGVSFLLEFGKYFLIFDTTFRIAGTKPGSWLYYWTVWHSIAHFWYDGFLWKMRLPTVRKSL